MRCKRGAPNRARWGALGFGLLISVAWGPRRASAQGATSEGLTRFVSPCASAEEFFRVLSDEHGVSRGSVPFHGIHVREEGGRFVLEMHARGGVVRRLADASCDALVRSARVIVVSAVLAAEAGGSDASSGAGGEAAGTSQAGPTEPRPSGPEAGEAEPAGSRPRRPSEAGRLGGTAASRGGEPSRAHPQEAGSFLDLRPHAFFGAGVSAALGPVPSGFVEVGGGVRRRSVGVALLGRYHFPTETALDVTGLRLEAASARLTASYAPARWVRGALGPSVTWLVGRGVGLARPETSLVWMVAPELDVAFVPWARDGWGLEAGLRGWVCLNDPRFELEGGEEVYRVPRGGGAVFIRGIWGPE